MLTLEHLVEICQKYESDLNSKVASFSVGNKALDFNTRKAIMGVINLSSDSWYRESICLSLDQAVRRGMMLKVQGTDLVDIGAESTLPHAAKVSASLQNSLILPLLKQLHNNGVATSVETYHANVARQCLQVGADFINLTGQQANKEIYQQVAEFNAGVIICYVQGKNVREVGDFDFNEDPIRLMYDYFAKEIELATSVGVEKIFLDSGLGFYYKNLKDSDQRIRFQMQTFLTGFRLRKLGFPVCQALPHAFEYFGEEVRSAESFFAFLAVLGKIDLFRTHEVAKVKGVLDTLELF